ncbi:uncharacterized protein [Anabrus simplex]|uniref:uncharacterized protein isoform X2 n=1 Tax=Anabrus simplex TaxID=316456 RepID=UPI0035A2E628
MRQSLPLVLFYLLLNVPNSLYSYPLETSEEITSQRKFGENGSHHFLLPKSEEDQAEDVWDPDASVEDYEERSRRDVCNNEVVSLPQNISALFNHSYEVRCSPKIRFEVDGHVVDVNRDMQLVLRFICLLARTYNTASQGITGYSFGYIVSSEPFNSSDFTTNSTDRRRFDVIYEEDSNNNTETYATFTHSCNHNPPGAYFMVGDRTVKPLTVVWMLLNRLACRDWWEGRTARDVEEGDQRVRRDILDNKEDESSIDVDGKSSYGHSCEMSCDLDNESLTVDGIKVHVTPHLQSALQLLCSALPTSEENNGHFSFKTEYITDIDLDLEDYNSQTIANKSFDIIYEDGHKRYGQNLYTFYWRCEPQPVFSVMGHKLASHSLFWNVINSLKCETNFDLAPDEGPKEGTDEPQLTAQKSTDSERRRKDAPSHGHNFEVRCDDESKGLIVDGIEVKITPHMRGAITFLCDLLSMTLPDDSNIYRLGYIATEECFNAEDYALNSTNNKMLDVVYVDGTVDTRTSVTVFGQTCFPYPLGPEFSLDAGTLQPRSVLWGLFSKVRCDNLETDNFAYFDPDLLHLDHSKKQEENTAPVPDLYTNNHTYEVRCTLGAESLLVDGLVMEVTEHLLSALRILCFSSGLHLKQDASLRLGYFKSIEYFIPQEYAVNSTSQKRLDVLFSDGIRRSNMRVASMMPNCQSSPPQFELNGKKVMPQSLVWTLYKKLECDNRSSKEASDPAIRKTQKGVPVPKSSTGVNKSAHSSSNTHDYAVKCRPNSEKLIIDGVVVKVTRHMNRVLKLLCGVIDIYFTIPQDHVYRFGYIVTKETFKASDYASSSIANKRLDVQYSSSVPRSDKDPIISLKSTCRRDPPGNELSLNGSRLVPHTIVWSLFSRVRCSSPGSPVPQEPAMASPMSGST